MACCSIRFSMKVKKAPRMFSTPGFKPAAIPATDYFLEELGVKKFALVGTDYVYPRTTNNILESFLQNGDCCRRHLRQLHPVRSFRLVQDRS